VLAARDIHLSAANAKDCVLECIGAYRQHLRKLSRMSPLEIWYTRLDMDAIVAMAPNARDTMVREQIAQKAHQNVAEHISPKIVCEDSGRYRFIEQRPTFFRIADADFEVQVHERVAEGSGTVGNSASTAPLGH
jgi:hypothetical protein